MREIYSEPRELSDLINKESENTPYLLRGFIRNPECIKLEGENIEFKRIAGSIEVSESQQNQPYLIPIIINCTFPNELGIEQVVNILKFFEIRNLELSFKGKYTNKTNGILNRIFNIDEIVPKKYSDSILRFVQ